MEEVSNFERRSIEREREREREKERNGGLMKVFFGLKT